MRKVLTVLMVSLVVLAGCRHKSELSTGSGPKPAVNGLGEDGSLNISATDQCPVCAMYPAKHPRFACAMELQDDTTYYFCATGCMIRTWLHPEVYLGEDAAAPRRMIVQDYFQGKPIDAMQTVWVAGSDVKGPMGPALVPLSSEQDADTFEQRHGGKTRFSMDRMDDALWKELTGKDAVGKKAR